MLFPVSFNINKAGINTVVPADFESIGLYVAFEFCVHLSHGPIYYYLRFWSRHFEFYILEM
jgi:hypothetical protein